MRKFVIFISSILLVAIGYLIEDRGLAMQVTSNGEVIYPISSGGDDGSILKLGLYLFTITSFYSAVSIVRGHREAALFIVYSINSLIYAFFLFLVMLDSSITEAAKLGDRLPFVANLIWMLSFAMYGALSLNKAFQPTPKSGAAEL